jgi:membrane protease YdiL (CAAX protease family)
MQTYLKTKPVWIQLLLFMGMAFGLFIVLAFIGAAILSGITGISLLDFQDTAKWNSANPNLIVFIRGMLVIQFLALFLIPSLLFAYFSDPHPLDYVGLKAPKNHLFWVLAIVAMVVAIPVVEFTGALNQQVTFSGETQRWMKSMEDEAARQIQFMLNKHTPSELILNLIFISLFAGIGEELFFRGILQRLMIRAFKNPWSGIVITALLFSAFHLQFFGFVPRFLLGMLLGAIYWYSGSIWTAIIAHFIYDGLIIVLAYFNPALIKDPNASMINPANMTGMAIVSAVLTILLIWQMKKRSTASYAEIYKNDKPPTDEFTF